MFSQRQIVFAGITLASVGALLGGTLIQAQAQTNTDDLEFARPLSTLSIESSRGTFLTTSDDWGKPQHPTRPPMKIYGFYSAGCLQGAATLPLDGRGYHTARVTKNRFYAHTDMLQFIERIGNEMANKSIGDMLIADVSQPRGGPMKNAHASHQVGLDVDVWFNIRPVNTPPYSPSERSSLSTYSVLRADGKGLDYTKWNKRHEEMLFAAAAQPGVQRIFVNPHIKKELCKLHPNDSVELMRRLRPYWGHDDHFHARLYCPASQPDCEAQAEVAPGNGCDELPGWFNKDGTVIAQLTDSSGEHKPMEKALPKACEQVLKEADAAL